jgi:hypothetical protein
MGGISAPASGIRGIGVDPPCSSTAGRSSTTVFGRRTGISLPTSFIAHKIHVSRSCDVILAIIWCFMEQAGCGVDMQMGRVFWPGMAGVEVPRLRTADRKSLPLAGSTLQMRLNLQLMVAATRPVGGWKEVTTVRAPSISCTRTRENFLEIQGDG